MAFKHFHQINWWITEDRVTALIKTHVVYFAGRTRTLNFELPSCWGSARVRFTAAACLNLRFLSPEISVRWTVHICVWSLIILQNLSSAGLDVYFGTHEIVLFVQMFSRGPSLILNIREYNARLSVRGILRGSLSYRWFGFLKLGKKERIIGMERPKSWCWWCGRLVFYYLNVSP
jgi:hypothetical protein